MRKSSLFFLYLAACLVIMSGLLVNAKTRVRDFGIISRDLGEITASLKLTDMSFSTDARYTRHPSQADLFSAFQDYPGSIEHFPSGSVVAPPDFGGLGTKMTIGRR